MSSQSCLFTWEAGDRKNHFSCQMSHHSNHTLCGRGRMADSIVAYLTICKNINSDVHCVSTFNCSTEDVKPKPKGNPPLTVTDQPQPLGPGHIADTGSSAVENLDERDPDIADFEVINLEDFQQEYSQYDNETGNPTSSTCTKLNQQPAHFTWTCNAYLGASVFKEIQRSESFRDGFLNFMAPQCGQQSCSSTHQPQSLCIEVVFSWPHHLVVDVGWCERLQGQVTKIMILEEAMAWLNTLGGGYSALGDYHDRYAEEAGRISVRQMKIALEVGDPTTVAKCKLYYAQSLMQQGHFKATKQIIRCQYRFSVSELNMDDRLTAMCIALWNRVRFLLKLKKDFKRDIKYGPSFTQRIKQDPHESTSNGQDVPS